MAAACKQMRRARTALVGAVLGLALVVVGLLGADVVQRVGDLRGAAHDNAHWTLSQLEIELLVLQNAVADARLDDRKPLDEVRRRFDVFYSRLHTLADGARYQAITAAPEVSLGLGGMIAWLDSATPLVDAPDATLRAELPRLSVELAELRNSARDIALTGAHASSIATDAERTEISSTLKRVAILTASLLATLFVTLAALNRLYRRAEAQAVKLCSTTARLETIISSSIDAILVVDERLRVVDFNGAAEEVFGHVTADVLGHSALRLFLAPSADLSALLTHVERQAGAPARQRLILTEARRKTGEVFPVEFSAERVASPEGVLHVIFLRDISDRMAREDELRKARDEAMAGERAKTRFLAVMSHEMRTPLNGLIGTLDLIEPTLAEPEHKRHVAIMQQSAQLLLDHVNDVLDISKVEAGSMELRSKPVDLAETLKGVVEAQMPLAKASGTRLSFHVARTLPAVLGDERRIRQVLLNLVSNAVKFTRGGEVRAEIDVVDEGGGEIGFELRVSDTGVGIAAENLEKVFEDFVTLDNPLERTAGGTGLGLGIARRIARLMDGDITVASVLGVGSTFTFAFRLAAAPVELRPVTALREASLPPGPLDVLIVEDNEVNRFILRSMLKSAGYAITEAKDGVEGVEIARARRFDVILTDVSMPRLDGIGAAEMIRAQGASRESTIIAVTAHAQADDIARFRDAKVDDWLLKPIRKGAVADCLNRHLKPRAASPELRAV